MTNSNRQTKQQQQPRFPLWKKSDGRWCRKIKDRFHYFGRWTDDPTGEKALALWTAQKEDLEAGRVPQASASADGLTLRDVCNHFLDAKKSRLMSGKLAQSTYDDYKKSCELLVAHFGRHRLFADVKAADFRTYRAKLEKTRGPVSMTGELTRIRCVLKFAFDDGHVDAPPRLGDSLKRPSAAELREARDANGPRLLTPEQLRQLIDAADVHQRAMIYLAINCGFGNSWYATPTAELDGYYLVMTASRTFGPFRGGSRGLLRARELLRRFGGRRGRSGRG